jgi:hypothetical protein
MSKSQKPPVSIKGQNVVGTINASGSARVNVSQKIIHQSSPEMQDLFKRLHKEIKARPSDPTVTKQELEGQVAKIEKEAAKGDKADSSKLEKWVRTLAQMAPDIVDVMAASLGGPVAGFTMVFKKIVDRARATPAG